MKRVLVCRSFKGPVPSLCPNDQDIEFTKEVFNERYGVMTLHTEYHYLGLNMNGRFCPRVDIFLLPPNKLLLYEKTIVTTPTRNYRRHKSKSKRCSTLFI